MMKKILWGTMLLAGALPLAAHGQALMTTSELAAQARGGVDVNAAAALGGVGWGLGVEGRAAPAYRLPVYTGTSVNSEVNNGSAVGASGYRSSAYGNTNSHVRTGDMGTTNTGSAGGGTERYGGTGADIQGTGSASSGIGHVRTSTGISAGASSSGSGN